jgi:hypothetical protein
LGGKTTHDLALRRSTPENMRSPVTILGDALGQTKIRNCSLPNRHFEFQEGVFVRISVAESHLWDSEGINILGTK